MFDKDTLVRLLGSLSGVFILSFIFGFIFWSVQLRFMKIVDPELGEKIVIVKLTDIEENSDVVFQYPHAESPMYSGRILNYTQKKGFLLKSDQSIYLPRELVVGVLLYEF